MIPVKLRIVVLYDSGADASFNKPGEIPPSEDISLVAEDVAGCLKDQGHDVRIVAAVRPIETTIGWIRENNPDMVFNLCEGYLGHSEKEGSVAGLLELMGLPYSGNTPGTLHLSLLKGRVKQVLRANDIPTANWFNATSALFDWNEQIEFPAIVKPEGEDASLGIESESIVRDLGTLRERVEHVLRKYGQTAIVEEFIDGREINVAMVGGRVLEVSEISFEGLPENLPRIVTYRGKWDEESPDYKGTVPVVPADLSPELRAKAERIAVQTWKVVGGRDYARVDLRIGKDGRLFVLEFNPNPDFSRDAGLANCARASGGSYEQLVAEIVKMTWKRKAAHVPEPAAAASAATPGNP